MSITVPVRLRKSTHGSKVKQRGEQRLKLRNCFDIAVPARQDVAILHSSDGWMEAGPWPD